MTLPSSNLKWNHPEQRRKPVSKPKMKAQAPQAPISGELDKMSKMMCAIRDSNSGPSLFNENWEANVMTTKLRALFS